LAKWIAGPQTLNSEVFRFNTKTTSTARDLFYRYDAIRHFGKKRSALEFITYEAFGNAILYSRVNHRPVVLVDEIDKAPRDFPNDLLFEFEEYAFRIEEAGNEDMRNYDFQTKLGAEVTVDSNGYIRSKCTTPPFLLLTSNSEKNLPDAFLRRCVFYHIEFPEKDLLWEIVERKTNIGTHHAQHKDIIIKYFLDIRESGMIKRPATAELVKWVESVIGRDIDWSLLKENDEMREKLMQTLPVLAKNTNDLKTCKSLNMNMTMILILKIN
jgi:MoxR-like ATPase